MIVITNRSRVVPELRSGLVISAVLILLIVPLAVISNVSNISTVLAAAGGRGRNALTIQVVELALVVVVVQVTSRVTSIVPTVLAVPPPPTPLGATFASMDAVGLVAGSIAMLGAAAYLTYEGINRRKELSADLRSIYDKISANLPPSVKEKADGITKELTRSRPTDLWQAANSMIRKQFRNLVEKYPNAAKIISFYVIYSLDRLGPGFLDYTGGDENMPGDAPSEPNSPKVPDGEDTPQFKTGSDSDMEVVGGEEAQIVIEDWQEIDEEMAQILNILAEIAKDEEDMQNKILRDIA